MTKDSALNSPLNSRVQRLLWWLNRQGFLKPSAKRRQRLCEKIIAVGPEALRTVLKCSRWEGWDYRDDVWEIMKRLAEDPIDLLIAGLSDSDREVRWSCCKWLRDKGEGQTKAIAPLMESLKKRPREGDVTGALGVMGPEARGALVRFMVDDSQPEAARMEAIISFPFRELAESEATTLREFLKRPDLDPEFQENIPALLKSVGSDED